MCFYIIIIIIINMVVTYIHTHNNKSSLLALSTRLTTYKQKCPQRALASPTYTLMTRSYIYERRNVTLERLNFFNFFEKEMGKGRKGPEFVVSEEEDKWIKNVLTKLGARKPEVRKKRYTSMSSRSYYRNVAGVYVLHHLKR